MRGAPPPARVSWGDPPRNGSLRESAEIGGESSAHPKTGLVQICVLLPGTPELGETVRLARRYTHFLAGQPGISHAGLFDCFSISQFLIVSVLVSLFSGHPATGRVVTRRWPQGCVSGAERPNAARAVKGGPRGGCLRHLRPATDKEQACFTS